MTKQDRIYRATRTLMFYGAITREHEHPPDFMAELLPLLLADLRHFCDGAALDFGALDRVAYQAYLLQLEREPDEVDG